MDDVDGGYEGKTVLVTGGAGAIGGNLVRRLNDLNTEKIVILDNGVILKEGTLEDLLSYGKDYSAEGSGIAAIHTLDDLFIALTGRHLHD